jgi:hypothetical protein
MFSDIFCEVTQCIILVVAFMARQQVLVPLIATRLQPSLQQRFHVLPEGVWVWTQVIFSRL